MRMGGVLFAVVCACLSAGSVLGGEVKKPWKDTAELSLVNTTGNSFTQTTSGKNTFEYGWSRASLALSAEALGAKSESRVTAEQYKSGEKGVWKVSESNYAFERFFWSKNRFAGIRNRYDAGGGGGRQLFSIAGHSLFSELGAGFIKEERIGSKDQSFASGRSYTKYGWKITETSDVSQDCEFLHNFEDRRDYRLNMETSLAVAISAVFSIKLSYLWQRVGKPPAGFTRDDTTTKVALIANF